MLKKHHEQTYSKNSVKTENRGKKHAEIGNVTTIMSIEIALK